MVSGKGDIHAFTKVHGTKNNEHNDAIINTILKIRFLFLFVDILIFGAILKCYNAIVKLKIYSIIAFLPKRKSLQPLLGIFVGWSLF
jgi:uncharacterized metal-binding protein